VEIETSDLVSDGALGLDERLAVFHLKRDRERQGKVHRMPNLLVWAERLPAKTRVVILDLGDVTRLDANAALEVCALLRLTRRQSRELILSGLTNEQFDQLREAGAGDGLDYEHVCPDLELAIARGVNMIEDMSVPRKVPV
jgi:ABC-type transporter Mla MlaB component